MLNGVFFSTPDIKHFSAGFTRLSRRFNSNLHNIINENIIPYGVGGREREFLVIHNPKRKRAYETLLVVIGTKRREETKCHNRLTPCKLPKARITRCGKFCNTIGVHGSAHIILVHLRLFVTVLGRTSEVYKTLIARIFKSGEKINEAKKIHPS